MMRILLSYLIVAVACSLTFGQSPEKFTVFDGKGNLTSIDAIIASLEKTDVVFLGELHDDSVGHAVQLEIFKRAVERYRPSRRVALSLEMFERDVQVVLNEYLAGQISENHFLLSSRPWPNYKADYRPLVELAKEKKLYVTAANAPRRYVNMVSRGGRDVLKGLSPPAKAWLAPLPYAEASEAYSRKFRSLMGSSAEASMGLDKILSSQSLWDATMADSVARSIKKKKGSLVVHLNGGFHTEKRLGTVEHLLRYRPKTRIVVVTIRYEDDYQKFDAGKHTDAGDFVILTQPKPKTQSVISDILKRVEQNHRFLRSLRANVQMSQYNAQLKEADLYFGTALYLPGSASSAPRIRMDWTRPYSETLVMKGSSFELYRPRLAQIIEGDISQGKESEMRSLIVKLVNPSRKTLRDEFEIAYSGEMTLSNGVKSFHLLLRPKKTVGIKLAEVWIDADGMVRQVRSTTKNGDSVALQLADYEANIEIKDDVFKIRYPAKTRKIRV